MLAPFKDCFFVCYSSVGLAIASSVGCQRQVSWTPIPQVGALDWGAKCVVQTLPSSGRSWELGILSCSYGALLRMEFVARVGLSLSYPISIWIFFQSPDVQESLNASLYIWCIPERRKAQEPLMSPSWSTQDLFLLERMLSWKHLCWFLEGRKYFRREMPNKYFK